MVTPSEAPGPIGPYTIGKIVKMTEESGKWGYASGALGLCVRSGKLVSDEVGGQTKRGMENLQAIAGANGFALDDAIKTTIFLTDMADQPAMNEIYAEFFSGSDAPPARTCVAVHQLPKGAKFEIEALFFKD